MTTTPSTPTSPSAVPAPAGPLGTPAFRTALGVVGTATALSAVVVAGLALRDRASPFVLGFELVTLLAGIAAVLVARGRFAAGPALTLVCAAGAVFASAAMSWWVARGPDSRVDWTPFLLARFSAAAVLALAAAAIVLAIRPALQLPRLAIGFALALPTIITLAWLLRGGSASIKPWPVSAQAAFVIFGGLILLALFSASVHYIVTAFQLGLNPPATSSRGDAPGAPTAQPASSV